MYTSTVLNIDEELVEDETLPDLSGLPSVTSLRRPSTPTVSFTNRRSFHSKSSTNANSNDDGPQESKSRKYQYYPHSHKVFYHQAYLQQRSQCNIKEFYEDDEICRKNGKGKLEFGVISRHLNGNKDNLKVFWTLNNEIEEEDLDLTDMEKYEDYRLIDRKAEPGDIIYVNKKRGEVIDVSWSSYVRILENGMSLLDIPCERLEPIIPHYPGQRLELDGWIGTVISIVTEATLMFPRAKSGVVDCSGLPQDKQPYPGRKVRYTYEQYIRAGLVMLDKKDKISELFGHEDVLEAFVLFLHVSQIEVKWNGKVAPVADSTPMPSTTLTRGQVKKRVRILGTHADLDWDNNPAAVDRFYQYIVQPDDLIITNTKDSMIEEYMVKKYYDYEAEIENPSKTIVHKLGDGDRINTNTSYVVRVLRFSRVLHVKWTASGKVEKIRSSRVTTKHSLQRPYHQFVQKKITLAPFSYDEYGITTGHDINDRMTVQWLTKQYTTGADPTAASEKIPEFREMYHVQESVYDLQPHFAYGSITPKQIVYRSQYCTVPEVLFTVGWIRSVNKHGQVTVVSLHTKNELVVYPNEIGTTGMRICNEEESGGKALLRKQKSMINLYGIRALQNSDKLFIKNMQNQMDWLTGDVPDTEHFTLLPKAPTTHSFYKNKFEVKPNGRWMRAVKKDQIYLTTKVSEDIGAIWIKGFRDRLDLFSVLMAAPPGTPYEGGLFEIDVQLTSQYPSNPPSIYLVTVLSVGGCTGKECKAILSPGIHSLELGFEHGMVPPHTLIESVLAIQSKLFVSGGSSLYLQPPSSAGSFQRLGSLLKDNEERETNAQILIDVLDLMFRMVMDPPILWPVEVINYFHMNFERTKKRLFALIHLNHSTAAGGHEEWLRPTFPMMPLTDGFADAVVGRIKRFEELIGQLQG